MLLKNLSGVSYHSQFSDSKQAYQEYLQKCISSFNISEYKFFTIRLSKSLEKVESIVVDSQLSDILQLFLIHMNQKNSTLGKDDIENCLNFYKFISKDNTLNRTFNIINSDINKFSFANTEAAKYFLELISNKSKPEKMQDHFSESKEQLLFDSGSEPDSLNSNSICSLNNSSSISIKDQEWLKSFFTNISTNNDFELELDVQLCRYELFTQDNREIYDAIEKGLSESNKWPHDHFYKIVSREISSPRDVLKFVSDLCEKNDTKHLIRNSLASLKLLNSLLYHCIKNKNENETKTNPDFENIKGTFSKIIGNLHWAPSEGQPYTLSEIRSIISAGLSYYKMKSKEPNVQNNLEAMLEILNSYYWSN